MQTTLLFNLLIAVVIRLSFIMLYSVVESSQILQVFGKKWTIIYDDPDLSN